MSAPSTHTFADTDSLAAVAAIAGEWMFDTVHDMSLTGVEERPTLTFDQAKPSFYATNGCNYFNGDYTVGANHRLDMHCSAGTHALCESEPWAGYIETLWDNIFYINKSTRGKDEVIELQNSKHKVIASLRRHSSAIINGIWDVVEVNGRRLDSNEQQTLVIDLPENTIHGHTGCNIFKGTIYQNPDVEMSIQFQGMTVAHTSGKGVDTEIALLTSLEQVEQAIVIDNDTLVLTDNQGNHLVKLSRK